MNLVPRDSNHYKHLFQTQYEMRVQTDHPQQQAQPSSAFPILAVALLSIMGTALLLASYYMFVVKCCSVHWHQLLLNPLRRLLMLAAGPRQDEDDDDSFIALSPAATWHRGLDEAAIRDIPSFQFKGGEFGALGCVVCLSEFQAHDTLRVLPSCSHAFHLDCIDIWLQTNANCPLCRTGIALGGAVIRCPPLDRIVAPSSSPQAYPASLLGSDEDFVVIELGGHEDHEVTVRQSEQREREVLESPRKMESTKVKKCHHVSIMGDERIDVRDHGKDDDQFGVQPIRRSFSWDSAADRQLYSTVREIMFRKNAWGASEVSTSTDEERDGRVRRVFFPFRQGRCSRNVVVPFEM